MSNNQSCKSNYNKIITTDDVDKNGIDLVENKDVQKINENGQFLTEWEKEHQSELFDDLFRVIDSITEKDSNSTSYKRHPTVIHVFNRCGIMPSNYVVFDLETTGLEFDFCDIIEIGAIKYIDHVEKERFHSFVNIPYKIPLSITDLTGITDQMLSDAPSISEVLPLFTKFIGDLPLIAHNRRFDMIFIQTALFENGYERLFNETIDTVKLAQKYLPQLVNHKLSVIKEYFNLDYSSHDSISDCQVTSFLYKYCFDQYTVEHKNDYQLSDFDNAIFKTVCTILNEKNYDTTLLKVSVGKIYVDINFGYYQMLRFKRKGKLKYWLIDIDFNTFKKKYNTSIHHTIASRSEGLITRLFIEYPNQLYEFTDYIVSEYQVCKENNDTYYNHVMNRIL
ncbi:exonuclease domain-containing protein [Ruminococcus sp.]|uniref:exonuclease domain-containing protein n=1 Tax=Ruminococcus sp. TaxID=41978 RepID=UPI0025D25E67|nr:exonuclease domain-containing protein [Ruminococcus sp.]MBQ9540874.1 hypothetical protein [Ruminococcus sp.]